MSERRHCQKCGGEYDSIGECRCIERQKNEERRIENERQRHGQMIESMRQQSENEREERTRKVLEEQQANARQIADEQMENQEALVQQVDFKEFKKTFFNLLTEHIDISADSSGNQIGQKENRIRKLKACEKKADLWLTANFFDSFDHSDENLLKYENYLLKTKSLPDEFTKILKNGYLNYLTTKVNEADQINYAEDEDGNDSEYYEVLSSLVEQIDRLDSYKYFFGDFDSLRTELSLKLNKIDEDNDRIAAQEAKAQEEARIVTENNQRQVIIQKAEQERIANRTRDQLHAENKRSQRTKSVIYLFFFFAFVTWALFWLFSLRSELLVNGTEWREPTKQLVGYYDVLFIKPALAIISLIYLIGEKTTGLTKYLLLNYSIVIVAVIGIISFFSLAFYICVKKITEVLKKTSIPLTLLFLFGPFLVWTAWKIWMIWH